MAQIFHPSANTISRVSIFGSLFIVAGLLYLSYVLIRSPYQTQVGVVREQPVLFSHNHHVAQLGIDCRYCHTDVEWASSPGMPSTETCMSCHSQIWTESPLLQPVRDSWRDAKPIQWTKVHDLPDFVYFHHGVHVQKGVACVTCHGQVDKMPLMWKEQPMTMEWCLNCHRNPSPYLGTLGTVFASKSEPTQDRPPTVSQPVKNQNPHFAGLTNCSVCHR